MEKILSRQRRWQIANPTKARILRKQTDLRHRYQLLLQGYVKTHEEIYDILAGYEKRNGKMTDSQWWDAYEYLDWKYNDSKLTQPTTDKIKEEL